MSSYQNNSIIFSPWAYDLVSHGFLAQKWYHTLFVSCILGFKSNHTVVG